MHAIDCPIQRVEFAACGHCHCTVRSLLRSFCQNMHMGKESKIAPANSMDGLPQTHSLCSASHRLTMLRCEHQDSEIAHGLPADCSLFHWHADHHPAAAQSPDAVPAKAPWHDYCPRDLKHHILWSSCHQGGVGINVHADALARPQCSVHLPGQASWVQNLTGSDQANGPATAQAQCLAGEAASWLIVPAASPRIPAELCQRHPAWPAGPACC